MVWARGGPRPIRLNRHPWAPPAPAIAAAPVIGVFATPEQARDFTPLLAEAHFHACPKADLAPFLYYRYYRHAAR